MSTPIRHEGPLVLRARSVLTPVQALRNGFVVVDAGRIVEVGEGLPPPVGTVVDLGDRALVPGFVDLHVHGGGGAQTNGADPESVEQAVRATAVTHARTGTTALVATTVSDTEARLTAALEGVAAAVRSGSGRGAEVLGAHLEGPWLSPGRAGAQEPAHLRPPTAGELDRLLAAAVGTLRMVTLAPEVPGALDVIRAAHRAGVLVSIGHTQATFAEAAAAFDAGARHVTHLFNAMPPLLHRAPGPAGAALADSRVTVEVIADGQHLHPAVLAVAAASAGRRLVAVTDAISATGLPEGRHVLGRSEVVVRDGRVTLADAPQTLAGSVLTMDRAVATLVAAGVPLVDAVTAATLTPAGALGIGHKGRLVPGADADLVVLDGGLLAVATVVAGRVVHDPQHLLGSVGWT
jgi:N-acetylglucosamine-6-phosphate deacetylase